MFLNFYLFKIVDEIRLINEKFKNIIYKKIIM